MKDIETLHKRLNEAADCNLAESVDAWFAHAVKGLAGIPRAQEAEITFRDRKPGLPGGPEVVVTVSHSAYDVLRAVRAQILKDGDVLAGSRDAAAKELLEKVDRLQYQIEEVRSLTGV